MWGELGPGMAHTCDSADATPCKGSVKAMKQIRKMGGLKGLASLFGKGGLDAALPGLNGPGLGGAGMVGGGLPGLGGPGGPDLSKFLKR